MFIIAASHFFMVLSCSLDALKPLTLHFRTAISFVIYFLFEAIWRQHRECLANAMSK